MAQDQLGYIWTASDQGVARFDGKKIMLFPGVTGSQYVKSFYKKDDGGLLVIDDLGVTEIESHADTAYFRPLIKGSYQPGPQTVTTPKSVFIDQRNRCWVGESSGIALCKGSALRKFPLADADFSLNMAFNYQHSVFFMESPPQHLGAYHSRKVICL